MTSLQPTAAHISFQLCFFSSAFLHLATIYSRCVIEAVEVRTVALGGCPYGDEMN